MKNKLLILGGKPIGSCDIVEYAKSKGAYTIVTDYLPPAQSNAKRLADEAWDISTADVDVLAEKCKQNGINAVFTGVHEYNIEKNIALCEKLQIPFYTSKDIYAKLSNKAVYKQLIADFGLPSIKEYYKGGLDELCIQSVEYPAIVKPVDGSSGFGIKICKNKDELKHFAELSALRSSVGQIIVEECVTAPEVTIFYVAQNGKIYLSAMADRKTQSFQEGVIPLPVMYDFPSKHLDAYVANFDSKVRSMLASVGVREGMVFMQAFWKNGEVYIYDIGYRLTGTQEYNLISRICGYNPLEMLVDYALSATTSVANLQDVVDPRFAGKYGGIITFLMFPGIIESFAGIDEIKQMNGVVKFVLNHEVGEEVQEAHLGTLVQIVARAFVITDKRENLEQIRAKAMSVFKVIGTDGNDLLIR